MSSGNLRYSLASRRYRKENGGLIDEPYDGEHRPSAVVAGSATAGPVQPATQNRKPQPAVDERPNTSASSRQSCESSGAHTAAPPLSKTTPPTSTASYRIAGIPLENFTYCYLASRGIFTSPGSIQPPTSNVRGAVRSSRDAGPDAAPLPPPSMCCAVCASSASSERRAGAGNQMRLWKDPGVSEAANGQATPEISTDGDDTETVALSSSPTRGYDSDETIAADGPDWTV